MGKKKKIVHELPQNNRLVPKPLLNHLIFSSSPPPHSSERPTVPASSDSHTQDGPEPPSACCSPEMQQME